LSFLWAGNRRHFRGFARPLIAVASTRDDWTRNPRLSAPQSLFGGRASAGVSLRLSDCAVCTRNIAFGRLHQRSGSATGPDAERHRKFLTRSRRKGRRVTGPRRFTWRTTRGEITGLTLAGCGSTAPGRSGLAATRSVAGIWR
jgi:hypothetical protein